MKEEWKDIDGCYQVSSLGRIRSVDRVEIGKPGVRRRRNGRVLKSRINRNGYVQHGLSVDGVMITVVAHRVVAVAFIPNPLRLPEVNHKDGDKTNNAVSNLEWSTKSENILHAFATGLIKKPKGELHGCAKLTDGDVVELRQLNKMYGVDTLVAANEYGIKNRRSMWGILNNVTWKHLEV